MRLSKTTQGEIVGLWIAALLLFCIATPAAAITWGEPDGGEHPNVGAMVAHFTEPAPGWYGQVCSGTLIHERVFLTAGHCTDWLNYAIESDDIDGLYVNFDEDALNEDTLLPVLWPFITHPDYGWQGRSNVYDVGLLILAEPVEDIEPATLAEEGFLDDLRKDGKLREGKNEADFTVVGYGGTLNWPPPEMVYEDKRQYAESEYQALLKSWLIMSQNHATGDGGTGYGDSGGPTFWTEHGTETLVSVTSWGDVPCVAIGITYRVDTADALDFIYDWLDSVDMAVMAAEWLTPIDE